MQGLKGRSYIVTGAALRDRLGHGDPAPHRRSPRHGGRHPRTPPDPYRQPGQRWHMGLHPHRRDRRGVGRAAGPGRRCLRRRPVRPGTCGRGGRRRPGAHPGPGGLAEGPRRQSDRDVPHRQTRRGADVAPALGGRPARVLGDGRQRRGVGGNGRGKRLRARRRAVSSCSPRTWPSTTAGAASG